mgnify:CR=1 FL=1|jgi:hypothetical protein|tara:strand:- start:38 stop:220 length:183 start_codon:yes stop_codon:yes gene_type:complete
MPSKDNQITNSGVPTTSGLEIYMTVTIDSVDYLVEIVATDSFGNAHKILRRAVNETIAED